MNCAYAVYCGIVDEADYHDRGEQCQYFVEAAEWMYVQCSWLDLGIVKRIQRERQCCPGDSEAADAESIEQNSNKTKKNCVTVSYTSYYLQCTCTCTTHDNVPLVFSSSLI